MPCRSRRTENGLSLSNAKPYRAPAASVSKSSEVPYAAGGSRGYQRSEGRQTEYQRPGFWSRQCGSAQFFSTIAADSVLPAGATGVELEHPLRKAATRAAIANLTGALPHIETGSNKGAAFRFINAPGRTANFHPAVRQFQGV